MIFSVDLLLGILRFNDGCFDLAFDSGELHKV